MKPSTLKEYTDIYHKEIEPKMHQVVGYFVIFFALFIVEFFCLDKLYKINLLDNHYVIICGILLNSILALTIWLLNKRIIPFANDEVGILISIQKINNEADKDLLLIYEKLTSLLSTDSMQTSIKIRVLPDRLCPKSAEKAHKIKKRLNARLIIWGDVDKGNVANQKFTKFSPIRFSYRIGLPPVYANQINSVITGILKNKNWLIRESDDLFDREDLTKNIKEICYFMIGAILYFSRDFERSLSILKILLKDINDKPVKDRTDAILVFHFNSIINNIISSYSLSLELWPNSKNKEKYLKIAENLVTQCRETGFEVMALLMESQISFANNQPITNSIGFAKKAEALSRNDPGIFFSLAFLYFYNKDLKNGWFYLSKALSQSKKYTGAFVKQFVTIIRWYEESFKEDKEKAYLSFPLGVLYYKLIDDKKLAKDSLQSFIREYQNVHTSEITAFIYLSKKYLKKIRKSYK